MNAWLPQASYPCGNFSDTSSFKFRRSKGSIGDAAPEPPPLLTCFKFVHCAGTMARCIPYIILSDGTSPEEVSSMASSRPTTHHPRCPACLCFGRTCQHLEPRPTHETSPTSPGGPSHNAPSPAESMSIEDYDSDASSTPSGYHRSRPPGWTHQYGLLAESPIADQHSTNRAYIMPIPSQAPPEQVGFWSQEFREGPPLFYIPPRHTPLSAAPQMIRPSHSSTMPHPPSSDRARPARHPVMHRAGRCAQCSADGCSLLHRCPRSPPSDAQLGPSPAVSPQAQPHRTSSPQAQPHRISSPQAQPHRTSLSEPHRTTDPPLFEPLADRNRLTARAVAVFARQPGRPVAVSPCPAAIAIPAALRAPTKDHHLYLESASSFPAHPSRATTTAQSCHHWPTVAITGNPSRAVAITGSSPRAPTAVPSRPVAIAAEPCAPVAITKSPRRTAGPSPRAPTAVPDRYIAVAAESSATDAVRRPAARRHVAVPRAPSADRTAVAANARVARHLPRSAHPPITGRWIPANSRAPEANSINQPSLSPSGGWLIED